MMEDTFYTIQQITPELVFIRWHGTPHKDHVANHNWVEDIHRLLEQASVPQYFFSDVRKGYATSIQAINRLAKVIQHNNYGGGVALGHNLASRTYVSLTERIADRDESIYYHRLRDALDALDELKPGISKTVDWNRLL
ncbi:MAG: hypothetical protein AAFU54_09190 [Chloroflexota bacterium]